MQPGDIRGGVELGYKDRAKYLWHACIDCGKERWVKGCKIHPRCDHCSRIERGRESRGEHHHLWQGGRSMTSLGYVLVRLYPDDFFYPMVQKKGYVLEHRLVVARALGRNLHPWEVVHHKNHIKKDNRFENLQLANDLGHKQLTLLEDKIDSLAKEIRLLRFENKQLQGDYLEAMGAR